MNFFQEISPSSSLSLRQGFNNQYQDQTAPSIMERQEINQPVDPNQIWLKTLQSNKNHLDFLVQDQVPLCGIGNMKNQNYKSISDKYQMHKFLLSKFQASIYNCQMEVKEEDCKEELYNVKTRMRQLIGKHYLPFVSQLRICKQTLSYQNIQSPKKTRPNTTFKIRVTKSKLMSLEVKRGKSLPFSSIKKMNDSSGKKSIKQMMDVVVSAFDL